jgi:hypothetical protein
MVDLYLHRPTRLHVVVFNLCSAGTKLSGKRIADDEEVETEVRKWLRQQSKNFCAEGFDSLVKRWDKCINVGAKYVEK